MTLLTRLLSPFIFLFGTFARDTDDPQKHFLLLYSKPIVLGLFFFSPS